MGDTMGCLLVAVMMNLPFKNRTAQRLGAAAFLFFLVKGLLWLIVPLVLLWWAA